MEANVTIQTLRSLRRPAIVIPERAQRAELTMVPEENAGSSLEVVRAAVGGR